jgi:alpha-glucosidase
VSLDGKPLLAPGALGVETGPENFRGPFGIEGVERASSKATWRAVWGNRSEVPDNFNQIAVTFAEVSGAKRKFVAVVRAYNEGVALRYEFPKQPGLDRVVVNKRLTEFRFGGDRTIYQCRNYEYGTKTIATMAKSEGAVTVDAGGCFVGLTDAERSNFSQLSWERKKDSKDTIVGTLHSPAEGAAPFQTSWEVMIIGDTAGKLYENRYIVENLNPPCAIADTSWISPGKAITQVRNTRMVTEELKKLCDFASAHKIEYLEIDHSWCGAETKWTPEEIAFFEKNHTKFWDDKPEWKNNVGGNLLAAAKGWVPFRPKADTGGNFVDLDVPALCAYGKSLNPPVGICLYVRGVTLKEFGGEHAIEDVFAQYDKWGVAGVKPGFVPPGSQTNERTITYMVKKAAEHKLIAVIHDAYFPSGLSRTYPNLMNVEGVAGEEAEHSIPPEIKSLHDIMLPFTRCLMGPVDYTPEMFNKGKTHCHQVAMCGVYHGRVSIRGGMRQWSPGGEGGGEIEFVEKLPGLFDEMKVFGEPGKWISVARRRGSNWYIASMSGPKGVATSLPLNFLPPGTEFSASIYSDVPGKREAAHTTQIVRATGSLPLAMEPNGGHLMIIEQHKP